MTSLNMTDEEFFSMHLNDDEMNSVHLDLIAEFEKLPTCMYDDEKVRKFVNYIKTFGVDRSILSLGIESGFFNEIGIRVPGVEDFEPNSSSSNFLYKKIIAGCESGDSIFSKFFTFIKNILVKLKNFIMKVINRIIDFVKAIWNRFFGVVRKVRDFLTGASKSGVEEVPVDNIMFEMLEKYRELHANDQDEIKETKSNIDVFKKVLATFGKAIKSPAGKTALVTAAAAAGIYAAGDNGDATKRAYEMSNVIRNGAGAVSDGIDTAAKYAPGAYAFPFAAAKAVKDSIASSPEAMNALQSQLVSGGQVAAATAAAPTVLGSLGTAGAIIAGLFLTDKATKFAWANLFGRYSRDPRYKDRYTDENFYGTNKITKMWYEAKSLWTKKYPTYEQRYTQMHPDDALGKMKAAKIDKLLDNDRSRAWRELTDEINGLIRDFENILGEMDQVGDYASVMSPTGTLGTAVAGAGGGNINPSPTDTHPPATRQPTGANTLANGAAVSPRYAVGTDAQYQNAVRGAVQEILTVLRGMEEQIRVYQGKASVSAKMVYSAVRDQLNALLGSNDATNPIKVVIFNKVMGELRQQLQSEINNRIIQQTATPNIRYTIQPDYSTIINADMSEFSSIAQSNIGSSSLVKNVRIDNSARSIKIHIFDDDIVNMSSVHALVFYLRVRVNAAGWTNTITNLRSRFNFPFTTVNPVESEATYSTPADNIDDINGTARRAAEQHRLRISKLLDTLQNAANIHVIYYKSITNKDVRALFANTRRRTGHANIDANSSSDMIIPSDILLPGSGIYLPRTTAERFKEYIIGNNRNNNRGNNNNNRGNNNNNNNRGGNNNPTPPRNPHGPVPLPPITT